MNPYHAILEGLTPEQEEFFHLKSFIRGFLGGPTTGKTHAVIATAAGKALLGFPGVIITPSEHEARHIRLALCDLLNELGVEYILNKCAVILKGEYTKIDVISDESAKHHVRHTRPTFIVIDEVTRCKDALDLMEDAQRVLDKSNAHNFLGITADHRFESEEKREASWLYRLFHDDSFSNPCTRRQVGSRPIARYVIADAWGSPQLNLPEVGHCATHNISWDVRHHLTCPLCSSEEMAEVGWLINRGLRSQGDVIDIARVGGDFYHIRHKTQGERHENIEWTQGATLLEALERLFDLEPKRARED